MGRGPAEPHGMGMRDRGGAFPWRPALAGPLRVRPEDDTPAVQHPATRGVNATGFTWRALVGAAGYPRPMRTLAVVGAGPKGIAIAAKARALAAAGLEPPRGVL